MFEIVDVRRTTDGRTPEHGYTISSPCEPKGSGELKMQNIKDHGLPCFEENSLFGSD